MQGPAGAGTVVWWPLWVWCGSQVSVCLSVSVQGCLLEGLWKQNGTRLYFEAGQAKMLSFARPCPILLDKETKKGRPPGMVCTSVRKGMRVKKPGFPFSHLLF